VRATRCRWGPRWRSKEHSPLDAARVNPTIPFWGGPTSLGADSRAGEKVLSYGDSSLRLGLTALSPKAGHSLGQSAGGWTHTVLTVTPGIPGDSGSAVVDGSGRALGVVSTLQMLPVARKQRRERPRQGRRVHGGHRRTAGRARAGHGGLPGAAPALLTPRGPTCRRGG
jgi:hypothetical protein